MIKELLFASILVLSLNACNVSLDPSGNNNRDKTVLGGNGTWTGTWKVTKLKDTYLGVERNCDDNEIVILDETDKLTIAERKFPCENKSFTINRNKIILKVKNDSLFDNDVEVGVITESIIQFKSSLGGSTVWSFSISKVGSDITYQEGITGYSTSSGLMTK